jgi:methionyl-tRNA formyltransferase
MERQKSAVLIGDGRMAQEALHVLEGHPLVDVAAIVHHRESSRGFRQMRPVGDSGHGKMVACDNVNDDHVVAYIRDLNPDIIFNVNNMDLVRPVLLEIPSDGAINFHNGPLPKYRGVNIPSWAIINGEDRHAVTWHFMDESFDRGAIISERAFDLSRSETAISLIFKCIDEGLAALPGVLDDYVTGTLSAFEQTGPANYYSRKDTPDDGRVDLSMEYDSIDRLVRGLSFHPFHNDFVHAHIVTPSGKVNIGSVKRVGDVTDKSGFRPGDVVAVDDGMMVFRCKDAHVALEYVADDEGTILSQQCLEADYGIRSGVHVEHATRPYF